MPDDSPPVRRQGAPLLPGEDVFRLLVSAVRDYAIFMLDPEGRVLTWNTGAERIKGYAAHEIIGRHFSTFYPPEAIARDWPAWELRVASSEGRFEDEGWRLRKDGTRFWANIVLTALRNGSGELIGFAKVTRDLTERREHEERLRESEERFRLLVEGVQDYAIFLLDLSGHVVSWNRGAERIKGYRADEIIGQHFSRFFPAADVAAHKPEWELREALRSGRVETESWRVRKDGTQFWANVIVTALIDGKGQHRGFAKVTRDLTARRQMEQLAESNRRINEFLAMLAHELRNPLAPIRNALSVMQHSAALDETAQWARDVLERQANQLTRLVDDLLDISRITTGKIRLRRELLDLKQVVERAVEAARPLLNANQHRLTVTVPDEPLIVDGDATRLSQVIINLLNNAAKYTPNGGSIDIVVASVQNQVTIAIRDNGIGIAPHVLPRIFDLFAQGDRSLARSEGGLGIGLTLARELVELHGGNIAAASEGVDRGAEFVLSLPLVIGATPLAVVGPGRVDLPARTNGARRVLVVDDNSDSADTMAMLLDLAGHTARIALDGPAAISAAADFRPHVVLLDIGLPRMNGYEVAQRLQQMPELNRTVLVAMTGYGQPSDRQRSAHAGFAHHLVKPIDPAALERVIASAACED